LGEKRGEEGIRRGLSGKRHIGRTTLVIHGWRRGGGKWIHEEKKNKSFMEKSR